MEKEQNLQEIDPIVIGAGLGAAALLLAAQLLAVFLQGAAFMGEAKQRGDKPLTKEINKILGETKWRVLIIKDKMPNAFVVGAKVIMITTGLKKILNHRETVAVMLHEAWHVKKRHIYKQIFLKYPLLAIAATASFAIWAATQQPYTALFVFFILKKVTSIPYDLTIGRMQETGSDSYAVRMGYGKEMAGALKKLEKLYLKEMRTCTGVCKVINSIDQALDEHPPIKRRVERILKKTEMMKALMARKVSQIRKIITQGFKK